MKYFCSITTELLNIKNLNIFLEELLPNKNNKKKQTTSIVETSINQNCIYRFSKFYNNI